MGISKIGLHINGYAAGDKNKLYGQIKDWQPTTTLVMDEFQMAQTIAEISPNTKVVFRKYFHEDDNHHEGCEYKYKSPKQWVDETVYYGNPHIFRHVANEPGWSNEGELKALVAWLVAVGEELVARGYKGVLGDFAVGTWSERDINSGIFDPLIRLCAKYKGQLYLGVHEYMGVLLPAGAGTISIEDVKNGTNIQPDKWPKPSDLPTKKVWWSGSWVLPSYWQIRRSDWFIIRAWEIGLTDDVPLEIWISEGGWDTLSNLANSPHYLYDHIKNHYGISGNYPGIRGHQTLRNYWNKVFPQWANEPGRAEYEQLYWWSTVLPEWVVGVNLFSRNYDHLWSGSGSAGTNYAETPEVIDRLVNKAREERGLITPAPTDDRVPFPPVDALWKTAYIEPVSLPFLVREQPNSLSAKITSVAGKTYVFYQEGSKVQQANNYWYPLSFEQNGIDIHGWARSDVWKFSPQPIVELSPEQVTEFVVQLQGIVDRLKLYGRPE